MLMWLPSAFVLVDGMSKLMCFNPFNVVPHVIVVDRQTWAWVKRCINYEPTQPAAAPKDNAGNHDDGYIESIGVVKAVV